MMGIRWISYAFRLFSTIKKKINSIVPELNNFGRSFVSRNPFDIHGVRYIAKVRTETGL